MRNTQSHTKNTKSGEQLFWEILRISLSLVELETQEVSNLLTTKQIMRGRKTPRATQARLQAKTCTYEITNGCIVNGFSNVGVSSFDIFPYFGNFRKTVDYLILFQ